MEWRINHIPIIASPFPIGQYIHVTPSSACSYTKELALLEQETPRDVYMGFVSLAGVWR